MKPAHSRKALGGGGNPFGHVSQWGAPEGAFEWGDGLGAAANAYKYPIKVYSCHVQDDDHQGQDQHP